MFKEEERKHRQQILELTAEYVKKYHKQQSYKEGDRINYAGRLYNEDEVTALVDSALDFWLTAGKNTQEFEKNFSNMMKTKYCSLVNSGSSANLLAFMALTSPLLGKRAIERGDEVITVAAGFPTTIAPILQYGAVPVFVDITIPQYNIDISLLQEALSEKTKAVMLAHTLGNPFDIKAVKEFCRKNNLWLIEDNCDSLGSKYILDGKEHFTGTIGDIGTSSFYPPHHITMGEGGAVYTDDALLDKIIRSMRDWGRDCSCPSGTDNLCGHRFSKQYGQLPTGYDHKYVYSHFGFNLKATDMQAAIGIEQLKKLPEFVEKRIHNYNYLLKGLKELEDIIIMPKAEKNSKPSWFGFMMTCKEEISRDKIVEYLEQNRIQTRMLFAGNMIKQPCFDHIRDKQGVFKIIGNLDNTNTVMRDSFWIGVYPGMTDEKSDYMIEKIHEFVKGRI